MSYGRVDGRGRGVREEARAAGVKEMRGATLLGDPYTPIHSSSPSRDERGRPRRQRAPSVAHACVLVGIGLGSGLGSQLSTSEMLVLYQKL